MKVDVKDVLTTMFTVVLANRNAIGSPHGLHRAGDARNCLHQRTCKVAVNVIDLRDVPDGHHEHMAPVARLLITAREHRGLAAAKRHDTRVNSPHKM